MDNKEKFTWAAVYVVILLIVGAFVYFAWNSKSKENKETITINKSVWDSIQVLANKPPETKTDTFWKTGPVIYVNKNDSLPVARPDPVDTTINYYSDSLKKQDIDVWIDFKIKGQLKGLQWWYQPKFREIVTETKIFVPQIVDNPVPIPKNGLYIYLLPGVGQKSFILGGGIDYISLKDKVYGYQLQMTNYGYIHSVKVGIKIY